MQCRNYGVMFIKFDIDCFLCNSYPCVLFGSLSHVINQESHVYSWNLGKIYLVHFLKFIPNFPLKHVITSTTHLKTTNAFKGNRSELIRLNSPNIIREIWRWFLRGFVKQRDNSASIYRFKVNNNGITRGKWNMFKVNNKNPRRRHWRCSGVFIISFELISHLFLVFLLLNLNK